MQFLPWLPSTRVGNRQMLLDKRTTFVGGFFFPLSLESPSFYLNWLQHCILDMPPSLPPPQLLLLPWLISTSTPFTFFHFRLQLTFNLYIYLTFPFPNTFRCVCHTLRCIRTRAHARVAGRTTITHKQLTFVLADSKTEGRAWSAL